MIYYVAWRQLWHRKRQSITSLASIAVGVSLLIVITCMQLGFEEDFMQRIISVTPHVQVTAEKARNYPNLGTDKYELSQVLHVHAYEKTNEIYGARYWQERIEQEPMVVAVSPVVYGQGLVRFGRADVAVDVRGIDPLQETIVNGFAQNILLGNYLELYTQQNAAIIGSGVANKLGIMLNDSVIIVSAEGVEQLYRVSGLYQSGITAYDDRTIFVLLKNAKPLFATTNPNLLNIKIKDPYKAEQIGQQLQAWTGLEVKDWLTENAILRDQLLRRRLINIVIVGTIFVVAAFGIANIMLMNVVNKRRDIAIMLAYGVSSRKLIFIYLVQGLLLGLIGSLTGVILGAILNYSLSLIPVNFDAQIKRVGFPIAWDMNIFVAAFILGIVVSGIASILPARQAAKIQPAEVIRRG